MYKLAKLNKLFEDFNVTELVLQKDDLDEMIHCLHEAKKQLTTENHGSVVIGFTADDSANSHVYPDLRCNRLKVMVGWETTPLSTDYSTIYTADELEKELIDFNKRIRLI
jgi:hypothetical protein